MELSYELFQKAVDLKRLGEYNRAINIYKQEIGKMRLSGDFHEFTTYARAMAKCLYLNNQAKDAVMAYDAIFQFNALSNPELSKDLSDLFNNNCTYGAEKARGWLLSWAPEVGFALNAACTNSYNKDYAAAIAGKKGADYSSELYIRDGLMAICGMLERSNNKNTFLKAVDSLIR